MKLSACLIVREDEHLSRTIESIRPWVDEIVIVSEVDNAEARRLADRFAICTDHLGTEEILKGRYPWLLGRLVNFGAMRQRSFDLATGDYLTWIDTDDVIIGGEHLREAVGMLAELDTPRLFCKYEYSFDEQGRAKHVQWRERVVRNDGSCRWQHRGHENIVALNGKPSEVFDHRIIWKHERTDYGNKPGLNLALVRLEAEEKGYDGWAAINLGSECFLAAAGAQSETERTDLLREAIEHLEAYWGMSGWGDQRCYAALKIVTCYIGLDPTGIKPETYEAATMWAERAKEIRPHWVDPHVALANMAMLRSSKASREEAREEMRAVLAHCEAALAGETNTPLATDLRQTGSIYGLMQAAHETLEDWPAALSCVEKVIAEEGNDPTLLLLERNYDERIRGIAECYGPRALDIVIAAPGFSSSRWDPELFEQNGVGGSETAVMHMAKRLAAKGHRVRVYGNPSKPGLWDGVLYYSFMPPFGTSCDVLVAWRLAPMLEWCDAKVRLLWVHDTVAHSMDWRLAYKADAILALSEWHRQNLVRVHNVHPDHVRVTQNGFDLERFDPTPQRNKHRVIYSSSPDRGLALLVDLWPRIREQVPDAELHVFYGFDNWRAGLERQPDMQHRYVIAHIEKRVRESEGIVFHGAVDQRTLAMEMLSAGVWCSPTWFDETSCISAMEAQAAGLRIVTSAIAALKETVGDRGVLIEGNWLTSEYQDAFVSNVVTALTASHWGKYSRGDVKAYAREHFSWDRVADQWESMMRELLDGERFGALPPYHPVSAAA